MLNCYEWHTDTKLPGVPSKSLQDISIRQATDDGAVAALEVDGVWMPAGEAYQLYPGQEFPMPHDVYVAKRPWQEGEPLSPQD